MKLIVLLLTLLFSQMNWSALGPLINKSQIPKSICKITFTKKDHSEFHCSGILLDSFKIKTAAHCIDSSVVKTKVICHNQKSTIIDTEISSNFSFEDIKTEILFRKFDHAILFLKDPISLPTIPVLIDLMSIKKVVSESSECAFFGVGQNPWKQKTGHLHGVKASSKKIRWQDGVMILSAPYNAVSMIGDSGAAFLCRKEKSTWFNIGTVSAHNWEQETIIAPNSYFPDVQINPLKTEQIERLPKKQTLIQVDQNYWVKPFSQFNYKSNTYNTVDRRLVLFTPNRIKDGRAYGLMEVISHSLYYLCLDRNLCETGIFKNVVIDTQYLTNSNEAPEEFQEVPSYRNNFIF